MPITLSDEEVAALRAEVATNRRKAAVADRATKIWNDPKFSDRAKQLWKEAYPEDPIQDYDLEQRVNARLEKERREREDRERAERERAADDRLKSERARIRQEYGFTDDAMRRLEDLMVERNIGDYEAAATYLASKEPKPMEDGPGHFWNHEKQKDFQEVAKDPEGWAYGELQRAVMADSRPRNAR